MLSESRGTSERLKILGTVVAATALVVIGIVVVGNSDGRNYPLIAKSVAVLSSTSSSAAGSLIENENAPWSQLPYERDLSTPKGWQIESDEPLEGLSSEKTDEESKTEASDFVGEVSLAEDDDIDSPLATEVDENGTTFVPELQGNVLVKEAEDDNDDQTKATVAPVSSDMGCFGLKKCSYRKKCKNICTKSCKPFTIRACKIKKFCRCFCKYQGNVRKAKRCVIYKRRLCKRVRRYRCERRCKKFCKRAPRCYCCAFEHIERECRKVCRKISYKTKCGKCRCFRLKCQRFCVFVCKRWK